MLTKKQNKTKQTTKLITRCQKYLWKDWVLIQENFHKFSYFQSLNINHHAYLLRESRTWNTGWVFLIQNALKSEIWKFSYWGGSQVNSMQISENSRNFEIWYSLGFRHFKQGICSFTGLKRQQILPQKHGLHFLFRFYSI